MRERREVDELGEVGFLVAPNNGHNLSYEEWCAAYPRAKRFVAKGIPKKLLNLNQYTILGPAAIEWPEPPTRLRSAT